MNAPDVPDDAKPPPRPVFESHIVKVQLPLAGDASHALISNESRSIVMQHPVGMLQKRFRAGETKGYFKAELSENGTLEIGDRVPDKKW